MDKRWGAIFLPSLLLVLWGLGRIGPWASIRSALAEARPLAGGQSYYVAPNGDDGDPGTETRPWRSIQKAADTLVAGDTVYIKAGTYREAVVPRNSGSAGQYITYAAYPGDTVILDGSGIVLDEWAGLITLFDKAYIRITGLTIQNAGPSRNNAGILLDGSRHILIERNRTYNTASSGIGVWNGEDILIDGNEVELACNDGEQECITVAGTRGFEVRNNHVHHGGSSTRGGEGIDLKDGSSEGLVYGNHVHDMQRVGIYVDAWDKYTHHIAVYNNIVHDVAASGMQLASEMGGRLENIQIYNNVAYHNKWVGIAVSACCPEAEAHPMKEIAIINNTLYNNGWESWGGGIGVEENADIQALTIRNNICSRNLYFQIAVDPAVPSEQVTVDHNLIDGYRGTEGEIYGADHVEGDPAFVNPTAADFHLRAGSPAIDKGSALKAPADDYDGDVRPQGGGHDIGADEYTTGGLALYLPLLLKR